MSFLNPDPVQISVDLLKELIAIPSVSRGEEAAAKHIYQFLEMYGMEAGSDHHNVWAYAPMFDADKPTLMLNSHIDTVQPVDGWQTDPFQPVEKAGCIYGLGSNDAGASLVCLIAAFIQLSRHQQPYNLLFLASAEEEVSGENGIRRILPSLPPISFALVGEPTGMQPAIAEKGLMVLDMVSTGASGHAAREEGDNAIYKALEDIAWFRDYRFPLHSELLGAVKMSVTQISAGTQHNVIPGECRCVVDIRSNECYTNEQILQTVRQHVRSQVTPRSLRLCSTATPPNHNLVKRALEMGRKPFGSPTLSDQALMDFPSMKMGPGESSRSHTANEYIRISEIAEAIEVYFDLLNGTVI
ncbi:MAG: M20 family metallo-hydrolase [Prevotellaceae bacterium]|jgi:acetylornithine deacetylase|nr:M20 family metallo-hydrolase [Prevotellaceae bacterium]